MFRKEVFLIGIGESNLHATIPPFEFAVQNPADSLGEAFFRCEKKTNIVE
jgi:hypothetical protein